MNAGEVFSVYFGMFSQLGVFGIQDGRLGRRLPLAASTHWATVPGSAAVVIASIATTSFDGAQEVRFKDAIVQTFEWFADAGLSLTTSLRLADTIFMLICFAGRWPRLPDRGSGHGDRARRSAAAQAATGLRPHPDPDRVRLPGGALLQLFVFQEQAQFTYLLSDPLGTATTDLFGTASGRDRLQAAQRQCDLVRPGRGPGDRPRGRSHPCP